MSRDIWVRYGAYLEAPPAQVLEWNDAESDARGWLVINSLRGGAAGGGTRMRRGVTREEVTYLAKAMQLKFAFSGPPSAVASPASTSTRTTRVAATSCGAGTRPPGRSCRSCYGTGGDVNVDEQRDVVPLCAELGIVHPQEGIVRGHLGLRGEAVEHAFAVPARGPPPAGRAELGVDGSRSVRLRPHHRIRRGPRRPAALRASGRDAGRCPRGGRGLRQRGRRRGTLPRQGGRSRHGNRRRGAGARQPGGYGRRTRWRISYSAAAGARSRTIR